jgi:hypothetical protein
VGRPKLGDTNNALDIGQAGHLLVSAILRQPIPIIIFGIGWKQPILKRTPFSYHINGIGLQADTKDNLTSQYYKRIL